MTDSSTTPRSTTCEGDSLLRAAVVSEDQSPMFEDAKKYLTKANTRVDYILDRSKLQKWRAEYEIKHAAEVKEWEHQQGAVAAFLVRERERPEFKFKKELDKTESKLLDNKNFLKQLDTTIPTLFVQSVESVILARAQAVEEKVMAKVGPSIEALDHAKASLESQRAETAEKMANVLTRVEELERENLSLRSQQKKANNRLEALERDNNSLKAKANDEMVTLKQEINTLKIQQAKNLATATTQIKTIEREQKTLKSQQVKTIEGTITTKLVALKKTLDQEKISRESRQAAAIENAVTARDTPIQMVQDNETASIKTQLANLARTVASSAENGGQIARVDKMIEELRQQEIKPLNDKINDAIDRYHDAKFGIGNAKSASSTPTPQEKKTISKIDSLDAEIVKIAKEQVALQHEIHVRLDEIKTLKAQLNSLQSQSSKSSTITYETKEGLKEISIELEEAKKTVSRFVNELQSLEAGHDVKLKLFESRLQTLDMDFNSLPRSMSANGTGAASTVLPGPDTKFLNRVDGTIKGHGIAINCLKSQLDNLKLNTTLANGDMNNNNKKRLDALDKHVMDMGVKVKEVDERLKFDSEQIARLSADVRRSRERQDAEKQVALGASNS